MLKKTKDAEKPVPSLLQRIRILYKILNASEEEQDELIQSIVSDINAEIHYFLLLPSNEEFDDYFEFITDNEGVLLEVIYHYLDGKDHIAIHLDDKSSVFSLFEQIFELLPFDEYLL